ncbi:MAG: protease [Elusimicrobia bacterium RIFCSPHIGHO2_02_FULL_57_9]|nr:MAG: protease [Elusimicrobia bacterium RIFCSPHIGHO2_02_FULL_57_9]
MRKNEERSKTVVVLIEEQYQDLEVWVPYYRLREAGIKTLLLGRETGKAYKSKHGYPVVAQTDYSKTKAKDLDGVIIPGGFAPDFMRRYPEPALLVAEMFKSGKLVASICHGAWILCSAGVLKGMTATCFYAIADDVKNAGARYVDREVVVDKNLITSRKPEDLPAFCSEIIKHFTPAERFLTAGAGLGVIL